MSVPKHWLLGGWCRYSFSFCT